MKNPFRRKKKGVGQEIPFWSSPYISSNVVGQEAYQSLKELQKTAKEFNHLEHLDTKRAQIALKFVNWYLFYIAVIVVGVPLFNVLLAKNHSPIDIYKLLTQVGTLLGSPLGFVVGYYFKEDHRA
jgi:hypothetical protein